MDQNTYIDILSENENYLGKDGLKSFDYYEEIENEGQPSSQTVVSEIYGSAVTSGNQPLEPDSECWVKFTSNNVIRVFFTVSLMCLLFCCGDRIDILVET